MKKIAIFIIIIILACCGIYALQNVNLSTQETSKVDLSNLEAQNNIIINNETLIENKNINCDKSDINTIMVENNSTLNISNSFVNKSGDSSNNGDDNDFYGTNSAILVKKDSFANITNIDITTNSTGSNAIFVTNGESNENSQQQDTNEDNKADNSQNGQPPEMPENGLAGKSQDANQPPQEPNQPENPQKDNQNQNSMSPNQPNEDSSNGNASANVENVIINTYKDKSRGLDATYNGKITAKNVVINTRGGSCAAVATDRGEGSIEVQDSQLNTGVENGSGKGSPCIYSTGNITVSKSNGTAYKSQIACIEGKNSITLNDCDLHCFGLGNREDNGEYVDYGGVFIYQSMSGDADIGTATFNATNSKLSVNESSDYCTKVPMFHITNTNAIINIENCELSFASNILLNISGQNQWGTNGNNGGNLEFNSIGEELNGNIVVDNISSLNFSMKNSGYNGSINPNETYGSTNIIIDSSSTWTLTGNSHISSLENNGEIIYGNYSLFINGTEYNSTNPFNK